MTARPATVALYPPGETAPSFLPGDFIVTTNDGLVARTIKFGERRRFDKQWCWTNHAALVVGETGSLIEALGAGLTASDVGKYDPKYYAHVTPTLSDTERLKVVAWAATRYARHQRYGFVVIGCEALVCLTGTKVRFGVAGQQICSGFVASALAEGGLDMGDSPEWVMPAELAMWFKAPDPALKVLNGAA